MKIISNSVVSELLRLLPVLIANVQHGKNTRVDNTVRLTCLLLKKLKKLKKLKEETE